MVGGCKGDRWTAKAQGAGGTPGSGGRPHALGSCSTGKAGGVAAGTCLGGRARLLGRPPAPRQPRRGALLLGIRRVDGRQRAGDHKDLVDGVACMVGCWWVEGGLVLGGGGRAAAAAEVAAQARSGSSLRHACCLPARPPRAHRVALLAQAAQVGGQVEGGERLGCGVDAVQVPPLRAHERQAW